MIKPAELKRLLSYDPLTGVITRRTGRNSGKRAGSERISDKDAYRLIFVCGKHYYEHRIAWAMMTGSWPEKQIDHEDGDGLNNRWKNLRQATQLSNMRNTRKRSPEPWLISGVRPRGKIYEARIGIEGSLVRLGSFANLFDAICARKSAEAKVKFSDGHGKRGKIR